MVGAANIKKLFGDDAELSRPPTLADEAADKLREMILLEKLVPGSALPEGELAEALGISRTPMREAIRLLEIEGLVEYTSSRRARVADPSLEELTQCLKIQGALEGLAGEQACLQATDAELAAIAEINAEMIADSGTPDRLHAFRRDMEFHRAIVEAAHNPPLLETHRQYNTRVWRARFRPAKLIPMRDKKIMMHTKIVDALLTRDPIAAADALRQHLENAIVNVGIAMNERNVDF